MRQLDPVERALTAVGQDIEYAGGIDAHIADAAELMPQQALLGQHAVVGKGELNHHLAGQRADPELGGRGLSFDGDRQRHPIMDRQLGAGCSLFTAIGWP